VEFDLVSGPAIASDGILAVTGGGRVAVRAIQRGNQNYEPASAVERSFTVRLSLLTQTTPGGRLIREPDAATFEMNAQVTISALSDPHFAFVGWLGDVSGNSNPLSLTVNANLAITAVFSPLWRLAITQTSGGYVIREPDLGEYLDGSVVFLTAIATNKHQFMSWGGDATSTDNPLPVIIRTNAALVAHFAPTFALTTEVDGEGDLSIEPQKTRYLAHTRVDVKAIPRPGAAFFRWEGAVSSDARQVSVSMDADKHLKAVFKPARILAITTEGQGEIRQNLDGLDYYEGVTVRLNAVAQQGWQFVEWRGDLSGNESPGVITLDQDKRIHAVFKQLFNLTVVVDGLGKVLIEPAQSEYLDGTKVQLTAVPASDHRFNGWQGGVISSDNSVILPVISDAVVTAFFVPAWRLEVGSEGLDARGFHLRVRGQPGRRYQVQFSSAMIGWSLLGVVTANNGVGELIDDQATFATRRFYRARPENP
jgi:trimeric autotransporter adhesin